MFKTVCDVFEMGKWKTAQQFMQKQKNKKKEMILIKTKRYSGKETKRGPMR